MSARMPPTATAALSRIIRAVPDCHFETALTPSLPAGRHLRYYFPMLSVGAVEVSDKWHPAIQSFRRDELHYNPEFWERLYGGYGYLGNATADELFARHEQIASNFAVFGSYERLAWPVTSPFSAWYWLRKDHHLRLEMWRRGVQPLIHLSFKAGEVLRPMRNRDAILGEVLFRFSRREWLERTLSEGHVWLNAASYFNNSSLSASQRDDELRKEQVLSGEHTKITTNDGRTIPIAGDLTQWRECKEYFMFSTSVDYHPYLYSAFPGSEACLVINDAHEFANRLAQAVSRKLPDWDFGEMAVHYYDPREPSTIDEEVDPIQSKKFHYAFEMEWRFACVPPIAPNWDHVELTIGSLADIAMIVPRSWTGLAAARN